MIDKIDQVEIQNITLN